MSNTYSPSSTAQILAATAADILQARLAPLGALTTVVAVEPVDFNTPALDEVIAVATTPATTQVCARTDVPGFDTGDSTVAGVPLAPNLYIQPFGVSQQD